VTVVVRGAGAVLAAGAGIRMGAPKAELRIGGERLVDRAVRVLRDGGCSDVLAVVRPGVAVPGATVVVNSAAERGLRSSLELAVDAVADADVLLLLLADQPGVTGAAVAAVLGAWRPGRIATARYPGRGDAGLRYAHPVAMAPELWRQALAVAGQDEGARALLRARPELVDAVDVTGDPDDLDTPADLARWESTRGRGVS
jgi:molybdenum cofactor cytidylyltransferase/nicotine blue oxidoreductase